MKPVGINISRLQCRAFTSLRSFQVRCSQITCCDSNTCPSLMQKVRFKDLICSHVRKSHESFPNPHPSNPSLFLSIFLSLCPSPPPPTYCTFQVWDSGWKTMKAATPPTPTLSCALGNGTGNQQSSPLTEITRAFLAERVEEESSVLLIPCPQHGLWFQLTIPTMTMWKASSGAEGSANPGISAALTPTLCLVCN